MSTKKIIIICVAILVVAVVITGFIFMTEPKAKSEGATKQMAMLVDVVLVDRANYYPEIVATGTVRPVEEITLSPLVSGQIMRRSPAFTPGGFVEKGELLLQIDPSDYQNTLELRKSEVDQVQTDLEVEMGRQEVAEQDLELVGMDTLSGQQRSLVLRKPQLNAVKANLKAAKAAVDQAQLDLSRTSIRAPFDAHILTQNVTLGSQVAPGDNLGRLVGTDFYWVSLDLPVGKLRWLSFPHSEEEKGSEVIIRNNTSWPRDSSRTGYLYKQVSALDDQTRLARVLVRVSDPFGRENENKPELIIGSFVEARIQGNEVQDVIRLNRDYVRSNDKVWVMKEGKLSIRDVEILLTDSKYAYITEGLEDNEKVVSTNLSTVTEGILLRTKKDSIPAGSEENEQQAMH